MEYPNPDIPKNNSNTVCCAVYDNRCRFNVVASVKAPPNPNMMGISRRCRCGDDVVVAEDGRFSVVVVVVVVTVLCARLVVVVLLLLLLLLRGKCI